MYHRSGSVAKSGGGEIEISASESISINTHRSEKKNVVKIDAFALRLLCILRNEERK